MLGGGERGDEQGRQPLRGRLDGSSTEMFAEVGARAHEKGQEP